MSEQKITIVSQRGVFMNLPVYPDNEGSIPVNNIANLFSGCEIVYKDNSSKMFIRLLVNSDHSQFLQPSGGWIDKVFYVLPLSPLASVCAPSVSSAIQHNPSGLAVTGNGNTFEDVARRLLQEFESRMTQRFDQLSEDTTLRFDQLSEDTTQRFDQLSEDTTLRFDQLSDAVATNTTNIATLSDAVAANTANISTLISKSALDYNTTATNFTNLSNGLIEIKREFKKDIAKTEEELKKDIAKVSADLTTAETELKKDIAKVSTDLATAETRLMVEIKDSRTSRWQNFFAVFGVIGFAITVLAIVTACLASVGLIDKWKQ